MILISFSRYITKSLNATLCPIISIFFEIILINYKEYDVFLIYSSFYVFFKYILYN